MAEHIDVWTVEIEQVRNSNGVTTIYDAARVTIDCIIEEFIYPDTPLDENTRYTVFDPMINIALDPPFTQSPPCGYVVNEVFSWTIPIGSPVSQTDDPYITKVISSRTIDEGAYRVYLEDHITYTHPVAGEQEWIETIFYDVNVFNPCVDTVIIPDYTSFEDILYYVEDPATTYRFDAVTDTISTTVAGAYCGAFEYTFASNDTAVGTFMLEKVDLIGGPAISIATKNNNTVGNYTITVTVTMEEYPTQTAEFEFHLQIDPPYLGPENIEGILRSDVSVPVLLDFDFDPVKLTIGEPWLLVLEPYDEDNDLQYVEVNLGRASLFVDWYEGSYTLQI